MNMIAKILKVAHHRNGIAVAPFYTVLFKTQKDDLKVAVVFDDPGYVAVLDVDLINKNIIEFGQNSWRDDQYEAELRSAIEKFELERSTR